MTRILETERLTRRELVDDGMKVIAETEYVGMTHLVFGIAAEQVEDDPRIDVPR